MGKKSATKDCPLSLSSSYSLNFCNNLIISISLKKFHHFFFRKFLVVVSFFGIISSVYVIKFMLFLRFFQVAAAPVAVTQSGIRGAEDAIEKAVNAKKQKVEQDEAVIAKQKSDKKKPKKVESRSEEDSSIFDSDEDPKAGLKKSQPFKNKKLAPALAKKTEESSDIESDSDGSDEEPPPKKQPIAVVKNDSKKESSSSDESSNDSSDEEEETKPRVKACATALKNGSLAVRKKSSDDDSGESEDEKLRSTLESFADQRVAYTYMLDSSQFGKLKRCGTIGGKDRISGLPDAILSHVLNYLTLKEAIATSILSRRWENLWTWRPNLDFGCLPQTNWDTYIQIVNHILKQLKAPTLHKLRIVCPLFDSHGHHVDDWISFILRKGVSELSFDYFSFVGHPQNYHVHAHVFGGGRTRNSNTVDCASLHTTLHNGRIHFETLTQLCLRSVNLSDEVFDLILSNCIYLERFLLMCTLGLVNAKCTTPNLKLKSLELYHCKHLEYLQLSAPNLMSFKYQGRQRTLCIKDAKHLASLSSLIYISPDPNTISIFPRGKSFIFSQFSSYLPKLESLVVSANQFEDMIDFTELDAFSNLKQLKLFVVHPCFIQQSYRVAASIIRAAPYLELLEIILPTMARRLLSYEALELTSMPPHQNFKEFKLYGFGGDDNTMKFLAYLVEYAVSLQKIDITALGAILCGDKLIVQPRLDWNGDDAEHSKNCMLQLRQTLHSNVQLVFHDG